jgi:hypothetical protein
MPCAARDGGEQKAQWGPSVIFIDRRIIINSGFNYRASSIRHYFRGPVRSVTPAAVALWQAVFRSRAGGSVAFGRSTPMNHHTSIGTVGNRRASAPEIARRHPDNLRNRLTAVAALIGGATLTFAWVGVLLYVLVMLYF